MPLILKGLFILARTRRGRKLLVAAGLGLAELAQGKLRQRATKAGNG